MPPSWLSAPGFTSSQAPAPPSVVLPGCATPQGCLHSPEEAALCPALHAHERPSVLQASDFHSLRTGTRRLPRFPLPAAAFCLAMVAFTKSHQPHCSSSAQRLPRNKTVVYLLNSQMLSSRTCCQHKAGLHFGHGSDDLACVQAPDGLTASPVWLGSSATATTGTSPCL